VFWHLAGKETTVTGVWLTKDERNVLMSIARRDYRVVTVDESKLVIDATRTKERDPNRHLRGMSPLELDKTMARLGLKNTAPFRRRR
jgi:Zn-finger nucleic acid-binding protein